MGVTPAGQAARAGIEGAGTKVIKIEGQERMGGAEYTVLPDRIETGTFLVAGAMTRGRVRVTRARPADLDSVLDKLSETGAEVTAVVVVCVDAVRLMLDWPPPRVQVPVATW